MFSDAAGQQQVGEGSPGGVGASKPSRKKGKEETFGLTSEERGRAEVE